MKAPILCLFLALAAAAQPAPQRRGPPPPAPPPSKPEDLCLVDGQVLNASTGEPLGKASLILRGSGSSRSYAATTNAFGQFAISGVEPGKYRLSATRTGFVAIDYGARDFLQAGTVFSLDPKQSMSGVRLRMTPHGVISGRVADEDSEPMPFLQVQAMRYRYLQGRKQLAPYGSATTNDLGEYRIFGLPPGRYLIFVSPRLTSAGATGEQYVPMYYPGATDAAAAAPLDVGPGAQLRGADLALSRRRTARLRGHLTDASGVARARATIYLRPNGVSGGSGMNRPTMIDPAGNFEIRGVVPGSYTLIAAVQDRSASLNARLPVEVGAGNLDGLNLTIQPAVTVAGRIRLPDQAAAVSLASIQVTLRSRDSASLPFGGSSSAKVKDDGAFTIPNVNPDRYAITLSGLPEGFYLKAAVAGGRDSLIAGLDLSRGPGGPVDLLLAPNAGMAAGVVQDDKRQPASGATVVLIPQEPERRDLPQFYRTAIADDSGAFSLRNLDPGQYKAFAWSDLEPGAYMDPDFLKPVENRGETITIREGSQESAQLKLIG